MFQTTQSVGVLEDGRDEVRVVERVRRSDGRLAVCRRAAGTQRLTAVQTASCTGRRTRVHYARLTRGYTIKLDEAFKQR